MDAEDKNKMVNLNLKTGILILILSFFAVTIVYAQTYFPLEYREPQTRLEVFMKYLPKNSWASSGIILLGGAILSGIGILIRKIIEIFAKGQDKTSPKILWYQHSWLCLPLILVFIGGAIGGVCAGVALFANYKVFRRTRHPLLRYIWTGLIFLTALLLNFILALIFLSLVSKNTPPPMAPVPAPSPSSILPIPMPY